MNESTQNLPLEAYHDGYYIDAQSIPRQLDPLVNQLSNQNLSNNKDTFDLKQHAINLKVSTIRKSPQNFKSVSKGLINKLQSPLKDNSNHVKHRKSLASLESMQNSNQVRPRSSSTSAQKLQTYPLKTIASRSIKNGKEISTIRKIEDDYDKEAVKRIEMEQANRFIDDTVGPSIYYDGDQEYKGSIDRRGITPHVTFTSIETPPSQLNKPLLLGKNNSKPVSCSFCSSTNLAWTLRCCFCGCTRMSNAPRMKFLIDMILSVDPLIRNQDFAKRLLDYAQFDRVAMKAEHRFKQASLVRAKIAIMIMGRTVTLLQKQIMAMIFMAWKGMNESALKHDAVMTRLIGMKNIQLLAKKKQLAFSVWRGYVTRLLEEREQRFTIALRRNILIKMRRMWSGWQRYLRYKARKKLQKVKQNYENQKLEMPNELVKECDHLRHAHQEARNLIVTATDTLFDVLESTLQRVNTDIQKAIQLMKMHPSTTVPYFEAVHGLKLLDAVANGQVSKTEEYGFGDKNASDWLQQVLQESINKSKSFQPWDFIIQWLNFQLHRYSEVSDANKTRRLETVTSTYSPQRQSGTGNSTGQKKKHEHKSLKTLQDLRTAISNPKVLIKLLCHSSIEAQKEYKQLQSQDFLSANLNASTNSTENPAAQLHAKAYLKLAPNYIDIPPDFMTRDAFNMNDFDSLYAYIGYIYSFYPNILSPEQEEMMHPLSQAEDSTSSARSSPPPYTLTYTSILPQWAKLKKSFMTDIETIATSQQSYLILLAKVKSVNQHVLYLNSICESVRTLVASHQQAVMADIINELNRRILGKETNIAFALEKETLAAKVVLPREKLLPLCKDEAELNALEYVFKDCIVDLMKVYRMFISGRDSKGLYDQEFIKIMSLIGIADKKHILRQQLQYIFQQCHTMPNTNTVINGQNDMSSKDSPEDSIGIGANPNEFFEMLVRVAHYLSQKRIEREESTNASTPRESIKLLDVLNEMVIEKLIQLAKKFQEQGLTFKKQLYHPEVLQVIKTQDRTFKRVFGNLSLKHRNTVLRGKCIDMVDFESYVKDKRLVDTIFPYGKFKQMMMYVQQKEHDPSVANGFGATSSEADTDITFNEFLEALAAIAVHRNVNPYVPLARKLESLVEEYL